MKELVPLLRVHDLDQTIAFYTRILGFELCWREGDTATLKHCHARLMFSTGENLGPGPTLSGTLYFYPEDVEALWSELRSKVQVEWPLETMGYGTREFGIRDCNGYCLAFAKVLEPANQDSSNEGSPPGVE